MIYLLYVVVVSALLVWLYFLWQHALLFHPKKVRDISLYDEHFTFLSTTSDGIKLEGCCYTPKEYHATLLYFGGRGQDSVGLLPKLASCLKDVQIITFNYRGYGGSKGKPSEQALLKDSLHVGKMVAKHYGNFSVLGYSLGSSVAAYLASCMPIEKLYLVGAFSSIDSLAFHKYHFHLPILRYHFNTCSFLQKASCEVEIFVSKDDHVVPIEEAMELKSCYPKALFYILQNYNHVELLWCDEVINRLKDQLRPKTPHSLSLS